MVAKLEASLSERPVCLVARQEAEDPTSIYIECCKRDGVDRLLQKLKESDSKFSEGPDPSIQLCLHEGDVIKVGLHNKHNNNSTQIVSNIYLFWL